MAVAPDDPATQELPAVDRPGSDGVAPGGTSHHMGEAAGTLLTALLWGVGAFGAFVGLGFATHEVVAATVHSGSAPWRSVVGAIAAMFLVASVAALLVITGRGVSLLPRRLHERHERHASPADPPLPPAPPVTQVQPATPAPPSPPATGDGAAP